MFHVKHSLTKKEVPRSLNWEMVLKQINFKIKQDRSESSALARVQDMFGVHCCQRTFDDTAFDELKNVFTVEVEDDQADDVLSSLKIDPSIEFAHYPSERSPA